MPTREEYWSRKFTECPNCGSTEEGDSIYKCKDTFFGGIASDIGEALGADEVTHCGKVFCEGCGSSGICFRDACPTCDAPATLIGEIATDSSTDASDDDSDDDDDSSYSSSSDDSDDDSDYSSSSYTSSSTPSVSKKEDEPKKDESSSGGFSFNLAALASGMIWLTVLTPTCSTKNEGKNLEQNKPAIHSEAPAVQAETEPEIVEPPPMVQNAPPQETRASPSYQTNGWQVEVVVTDEIFTEVPVPQEARFIAIDCPSDGLVKVFHSYAQQGIIYDCALPFNIGEVQYLRIGFSAKGDAPVLVRVGFSY